MNLSKNFTLEELVKSETALRLNIPNIPTKAEIENLRVLCEKILQPIRDKFGGVKINSGYRCPAVNKAAGGSKTSDHMTGCAADLEIPGMANYDLASYISQNFRFTQVILEFYTRGIPDSGWVHVSYNPERLINQALTAVRKDIKTVYLPGLYA